MSLPYLLIAAPIHESKRYIIKQWIEHLSKIEYPNRDILLVDNSPTDDFYNEILPLCHEHLIRVKHFPGLDARYHKHARYANIEAAYNLIRQYTLLGKYDLLGFIECDNFPPVNFLTKWRADLAAHQSGVIIAPYWNNGQYDMDHKLLMTDVEDHIILLQKRMLEPLEAFGRMDGKVKQCYGGAFGTLLMHTSVLLKIAFHAEHPTGFCDTFFFVDCFDQNVKVIMDCSMPVQHINEPYYLDAAAHS